MPRPSAYVGNSALFYPSVSCTLQSLINDNIKKVTEKNHLLQIFPHISKNRFFRCQDFNQQICYALGTPCYGLEMLWEIGNMQQKLLFWAGFLVSYKMTKLTVYSQTITNVNVFTDNKVWNKLNEALFQEVQPCEMGTVHHFLRKKEHLSLDTFFQVPCSDSSSAFSICSQIMSTMASSVVSQILGLWRVMSAKVLIVMKPSGRAFALFPRKITQFHTTHSSIHKCRSICPSMPSKSSTCKVTRWGKVEWN